MNILENFKMSYAYFVLGLLMVCSVIGQLWSLKALWHLIDNGAKLSNISMIIFNFVLVIMFSYMFYTAKKQEDLMLKKDLTAIIEKYGKKEVKNDKKKL